ncbi:MAG TPA: hypothetical protein VHC48_10970 [Puia sp.]|nr:hypothetical protein [Puia sp.]
MNRKLSRTTRTLTLIASIAMVAVLFQPIWRIELTAPQYPEGLVLKIFAHRIGGDVDVVNGLNHYIGMRTLHTRDFVEFVVLPYIIGGFAALGILVTLTNRRSLYYGWTILFLLIAFTSMIDFYRWEYNYGHNLDEGAPIKVPGMAYQPPLLGYKQLLNFSAWSVPDIGGWIFVSVGLILLTGLVIEVRHVKTKLKNTTTVAVFLLTTLIFTGCSTGPTPIQYGQDACDFCKMGFSDRRFGFELATTKGKLYKFDDFHCLKEYIKTLPDDKKDIASIYCIDFSGDGRMGLAEDSYFLQSPGFHSPMDGDIAAFLHRDSADKYQKQFQAKPITWKELYQ